MHAPSLAGVQQESFTAQVVEPLTPHIEREENDMSHHDRRRDENADAGLGASVHERHLRPVYESERPRSDTQAEAEKQRYSRAGQPEPPGLEPLLDGLTSLQVVA